MRADFVAIQTIKYLIMPNGAVEEEVLGVAGSACHELTRRIEERLGTLSSKVDTSSAYSLQHSDVSMTETSLQVSQRI